MGRRWLVAGAAVLVVGAAIGVVVIRSRADGATASAATIPTSTATVERGTLTASVSVDGTLTHRARADGTPYPVINQARGILTELPGAGDAVACGAVLYRIDDRPVLLLCGSLPAYRDLHVGDVGNDVRQLNANLHQLGADAAVGVGVAPDDEVFTERTQQALAGLQRASGLGSRGATGAAGALAIGDAVVLPGPVRIATVTGELGGSATPGTLVAQATSDVLEVQVTLEASQQGEVRPGARARITLPGNRSVTGVVDRVGTIARLPAAQSPGGQTGTAEVGAATLLAAIALDDPASARGLDQAPATVDITTDGVDDVLSVPVAAVVGRSGGGFAVEVVRDAGHRELAAVRLGRYDATLGRVQVDGDVREGDRVVVPSS